MNTIDFTKAMWENHAMDKQLGRAVGETGRFAGLGGSETGVRAAQEDKVIDLTAWKAENLVELEERSSGLGSYEGRELVRRRRRKHDSALVKVELAATLSVAGAMLALIIRVLAF